MKLTLSSLTNNLFAESNPHPTAENEIRESTPTYQSDTIHFVSHIINNAIEKRTSDIHIEPFGPDDIRVRFRIDGMLHPHRQLSRSQYDSITTRLKIMAGMDIAEKRLPQDGRFTHCEGTHPIDIRVASLPTTHGEKLVLRLLDPEHYLKTIQELGFSRQDEVKVRRLIQKNQGIIIINGPTNCGKTTTLYSLLNTINQESRNITTLEDPAEIDLVGINQIQINEKQGLDYENGLRAVLRQDPNVIMLGEIRDDETALAAFRAAMTGHLVFSTLHTIDAFSTIDRLINMGVPIYLIASVLEGVISQRLVRLLCPRCKEAYSPASHERQFLQDDRPALKLFRAVGCPHCQNTGYYGRAGLFEVLALDDALRVQLKPGIGQGNTQKWLDYRTPFHTGIRSLIERGMTSYEEGLRVTSY